MKCENVNRFLDRKVPGDLPPDLQAHVGECAGCRAVVNSLQNVGAKVAPPRGRAISTDFLNELKPVRHLPSGPVLMSVYVLIAALVLGLGVWLWGMSGWHVQSPPLRVLLFGALSAALLASAYGLTVQMVPGASRRLAFPVVELAALGIFILTVVAAFHQSYSFPLPPVTESCFVRGLLMAGIALGLAAVALRRGVWLDRIPAALNIGAFLASASLLVLTFYCPIQDAAHVFIGHLSVVAIVLASGLLLGVLGDRKR